ncbi:TonB-dependent receptor [Shewanella sp. 202IG2-18]|uniref:TonB-dependent receptor plug domain-containing protein n=1 Tax=Parashewanella hymeniacidonis TaxID=2807618 RepID=UPI00195F7635|nr:TonB-dependent receptor [Parashewanella hymeniacidonis]MBM7073227.1 TonB-dependent receptor [Parashewanella hymeniacidonis]
MNKTFTCHTLALAISAAFSAPLAYANTTDEPTNAAVERVSVLGSRVSSRTETDSAVPVDIIDGETLTKSGFTELGQSLQSSVPSFNFTRTQVSDGSDLYRPATLRGLQPDQTLVLVNGKRRHNQALLGLNGTVGAGSAGTDMNAIPLIALKDVQVLRDGAAAQYGSDAIAGVINVSLKDSTDVTSGYIQAGSTTEGDGGGYSLGFNTGFALAEDGFFNVSLEYRDVDGTNRAQRDTVGSSTVPSGSLSDEVRYKQGNADAEFLSIFYNSALLLGEAELYSFGGFSKRTALGNGFYRSFNDAAKNVPQVYPDGFLPFIDNEAKDTSVALGLRGDFSDDWQYDVSAVYGRNAYDFGSEHTINASYAAEYIANNPDATDSEIAANAGPRAGYSGGFRFDQLTFNADVSGAIEIGRDEPLYVAFGAEYRKENYEIVAGEFASYSCGRSNDSSFASVIDDSVFAACGFQAFPGLRPEAAGTSSRNSYAAYLDVETQLTSKWLVGTALRYENFSDAGSDLVGKISTRYDINDDFGFRGAVATGFRAPSLQQSGYTAFTTNLDSSGGLSQSFTALAGSSFPAALGVNNLELESSKSLSVGFVANVSDSVSVTVDAYRVQIEDRITLGSLLTPEQVSFSPEAVAALEATGAAQANYFANSVNSTTQGIDLITTYKTELAEGDFNITFAGNLNSTKIDNVNTPEGIPTNVALADTQRSFLTGGQPKQRATLTFDYDTDKWGATVRANYFGKTEVDYFGNNHIYLGEGFLPTSVVEAAVLIDVNYSYQLTESLRLDLTVNNIFDKRPDELGENEVLDVITGGAFRYPVRAVPYGFDGTSYSAKLNFTF